MEGRPPLRVSAQAVLGDPLFDLPLPSEISRALSTPQLALIADDLQRRLRLVERRVQQLDQVVDRLQARTLAARWARLVQWLRSVWMGLWRRG